MLGIKKVGTGTVDKINNAHLNDDKTVQGALVLTSGKDPIKSSRDLQKKVIKNVQNHCAVTLDVLKVTARIMSRNCSRQLPRECMLNQEKSRIKPNVNFYNKLISACRKNSELDLDANMLEYAVQHGIYQPTLGYDPKNNLLDLHVNSVYLSQPSETHEPGITSAEARAIFRYHRKKGNISIGTRIVVGWGGNNSLRTAIEESLERDEMNYRQYQSQDGKVISESHTTRYESEMIQVFPTRNESKSQKTDLTSIWLLQPEEMSQGGHKHNWLFTPTDLLAYEASVGELPSHKRLYETVSRIWAKVQSPGCGVAG